jgi:hypothetical protein
LQHTSAIGAYSDCVAATATRAREYAPVGATGLAEERQRCDLAGVRRRASLVVLIALSAAIVAADSVYANPPITAKPISRSSVTIARAQALALAKTFGLAAADMEPSCANTTAKALGRLRIQAKAPAAAVRAVKYFLEYGHVVFQVDSECQAAKKFSGFAIASNVLAKNLYPSCTPPGTLLYPCSYFAKVSFRTDRDFRDIGFDTCYWSVFIPGDVITLAYGGNTIRYSPDRGC